MKEEIISWLMEGDVSIQYQTQRDLLNHDDPKLRKRIAKQGWGALLLSCKNDSGHWGQGFYQPKWTSSHYTLLDLKNLNIHPSNIAIKNTIHLIFENEKGADGGINPSGFIKQSDVCVNGMALNYSSYFNIKEQEIKSVIDFLLSQKMPDGGFNCHSNRKGAVHSSLHTTLSVLEGFLEYLRNGYAYRLDEILTAKASAETFILMHQLFRSDKTGKIIKPDFLKLYYPCRWYYDRLRALDYFQLAKLKYDPRMGEAIGRILNAKNNRGQWKLPAPHPGKMHFVMEQAGKPSRWNTLRALRVLKDYEVFHKTAGT